ncbi:MAG: VirB3 family type IV secretion system protein [Synergistaceae bacterium]|nr:VirB3 family type IV secretion system protein [Synergistaceae bacterium]MBQ7569514.1 VirB3 family type IV secretion system protein [Synergistaceae bacterium]MBR0045156.1 VirB3 family type IV secretion system protein [Synergistaceae bacterium]
MEERLRVAIVRRSLTRPQFIFGCDRTLFLLLLLACMGLGLPGGIASGNFINFFIAIILFAVGVQILRAMAKKDPLIMNIFRKSVKYQESYSACSYVSHRDREY